EVRLRVLRGQRGAGANDGLRKPPPLGVRQSMLPSRSMAAACVVPSAGTSAPVPALGTDAAVRDDPPRRLRSPGAGASDAARSILINAARSRAYPGPINSATVVAASAVSPE